mgnify:CR=1 FL=1
MFVNCQCSVCIFMWSLLTCMTDQRVNIKSWLNSFPLPWSFVMKVTTPEISWHERDPIYSVDVQPGCRQIKRLASGGVDKFVRVSPYIQSIDRFLCWSLVLSNQSTSEFVNKFEKWLFSHLGKHSNDENKTKGGKHCINYECHWGKMCVLEKLGQISW